MQKPIPENVTGVQVTLDAIDPNGTFINIGTVTTDISGSFGYIWTPETPGKYLIFATFMGSHSYGSSMATTYVGVSEAPQAPTAAEEADYTPLFMGIIAAVVVVAILVLYTLFTVRKQRK